MPVLRAAAFVNRLQSRYCHRPLTTLGIRREDPGRVWERRAPLTPEAVSILLSEHGARHAEDCLRMEVESCRRRCFPDQAYAEAGAIVVLDLSPQVDLVLGIKEPPVSEVQKLVCQAGQARRRTWMVFSHTHKGQVYNKPLLASFLGADQQQTLIDYELLTAPSERDGGSLQRVAAFGWYAGAVGAGEALSLAGLGLLNKGTATPLLHLPRPYTFPGMEHFRGALRRTGKHIRDAPTDSLGSLGPIVIGLTGGGKVARGAKDMLDELGVVWTTIEELPGLRARAANTIYAYAIPPSDYFVRDDGMPYSRPDYYESPGRYRSVFSDKIGPHLTALINGAGWQQGFPRIMTKSDLASLTGSTSKSPKLVGIQDITCDIAGNFEFVDQHTTIDRPYTEEPGGILISSIDILPTELPTDASQHFSSSILPYVRHLVSDRPASSNVDQRRQVAESLERATIVKNGTLTAIHAWLGQADSPSIVTEASASPAVNLTSTRTKRRTVLLLGSGLVAGPAVEVFTARPDVHLAIASNNAKEAQRLVRDRQNVEAFLLDVSDHSAISQAVRSADVVVSLLPAPMHPQVARHCIAHGKHLVTASYVSPELLALQKSAMEKDVLLLGECGLDPGIDSMAAMRIMERVRREGKKVNSFVSWCGGLPEPSASNVPFGYKFSWSPKAVLTAAMNDARFKLDGRLFDVTGPKLLASASPSVKLWNGLALEGLANRDSMPYADKYGLGPVEGLQDLFRGTLRFQGFAGLLDSFVQMGFTRSEPLSTMPRDWPEFLMVVLNDRTGAKHLSSRDVLPAIRAVLGEVTPEIGEALHYLSLLPSTELAAPLPPSSIPPTPVDYFVHLLSHKLAYLPNERDMVLLHHKFRLITPQDPGAPGETVTASLIAFGDERASAMATTVGKTLAFAALRVLDGQVRQRGVTGPYKKEVWEGVLNSLEEVGVKVEEKWGREMSRLM